MQVGDIIRFNERRGKRITAYSLSDDRWIYEDLTGKIYLVLSERHTPESREYYGIKLAPPDQIPPISYPLPAMGFELWNEYMGSKCYETIGRVKLTLTATQE